MTLPAPGESSAAPALPEDRLRDFSADKRLLILTPMAAVIGVISAGIAAGWRRMVEEEQFRDAGWLSRVGRRNENFESENSANYSP
jgi:hypothetical protein